ncbi:MAG: ComF family protein [Proteobacteria bacterium]|nr:ComF family protein [Pseudomonadota bacterium]
MALLKKFVENATTSATIILNYRKPKVTILPQPHPLRQFGQQLTDLLLPGSCLLCGADSGRAPFCPACAADLPPLPAARCPQCGEPSTQGERCGSCLKEPPHFAGTLALFRYDFPADRIIHALKYGHQLAVADWLGELLAARLGGRQFDLVVPLPLHPDRLRERGFNQAVEIARALIRASKQKLAVDCLFRIRATPPQAALALKDRVRNVRQAFECRREISGQHILLIDDVMTSGATLNEATRILMLHGARRVDVAVAARALKH